MVRTASGFMLMQTYGNTPAIWQNNTLKAFGHQGYGPGEFPDEVVQGVNLAADGNVYLARVDARVNRINPGTLAVTTLFKLPWSPTTLLRLHGLFLAAPTLGYDIVAFDSTGSRKWKRKSPFKPKAYDVIRLTASGDTAYWITQLYTYGAALIRLSDGAVLKSLRLDPAWFRSKGYAPNDAPPPTLYGVQEFAKDRLLFIIHVADSEWKRPARGLSLDQVRPDQNLDTILELVDMQTSKVVTSMRVDPALHIVNGSSYLWMTHELLSGDIAFDIVQPTLTR